MVPILSLFFAVLKFRKFGDPSLGVLGLGAVDPLRLSTYAPEEGSWRV